MVAKLFFLILGLQVLSACHPSALNKEDALAGSNQAVVNNHNANNPSPTPDEALEAEQAKQGEAEDQNQKFRIAPEEFKGIDFENFTYPYRFSYGKRTKMDIALEEGEYVYDLTDDRGWFSFSDVYYVDLTNDGKPEAIVILWHVTCGVSCDGGAGVFYIYTAHQNKLKSLWQYETGSRGYGCGLKSFTVKNRKITMELFGRCSNGEAESGEAETVEGKFLAKDTTRLTFGFNGRRFVEEEKSFLSAPTRNVMNYEVEISISN